MLETEAETELFVDSVLAFLDEETEFEVDNRMFELEAARDGLTDPELVIAREGRGFALEDDGFELLLTTEVGREDTNGPTEPDASLLKRLLERDTPLEVERAFELLEDPEAKFEE